MNLNSHLLARVDQSNLITGTHSTFQCFLLVVPTTDHFQEGGLSVSILLLLLYSLVETVSFVFAQRTFFIEVPEKNECKKI